MFTNTALSSKVDFKFIIDLLGAACLSDPSWALAYGLVFVTKVSASFLGCYIKTEASVKY